MALNALNYYHYTAHPFYCQNHRKLNKRPTVLDGPLTVLLFNSLYNEPVKNSPICIWNVFPKSDPKSQTLLSVIHILIIWCLQTLFHKKNAIGLDRSIQAIIYMNWTRGSIPIVFTFTLPSDVITINRVRSIASAIIWTLISICSITACYEKNQCLKFN